MAEERDGEVVYCCDGWRGCDLVTAAEVGSVDVYDFGTGDGGGLEVGADSADEPREKEWSVEEPERGAE